MFRTLRGPVAACVAMAAAVAGPVVANAQAKPAKVTGQQTVVALSGAATSALTGAGVTVTPLAPATATDAGVAFPVSGGHVKLDSNRGWVRHKGGLSLASATRTVKLRNPITVVTRHASFLTVRVDRKSCRAARRAFHGWRRHCVLRHVRVFKLDDLKRTDAGGSTTITADLKLTKAAAALLNAGFGTTFAAGAPAGTATTTLTTVP